MITIFERNKTHSILRDYRPIVFYDDESKTWLAFWSGHLMSGELALLLCSKIYWKNTPSPETRRMASHQWASIYGLPNISKYTSGLPESDEAVYDYFYWYRTKVTVESKDKIPEYEVFKWFEDMLIGKCNVQ